jgi:hypothetical protein
MSEIRLIDIKPDIFLKNPRDGLYQLVHLKIENLGGVVRCLIDSKDVKIDETYLDITPGCADYDIYIKEPEKALEAEFLIKSSGNLLDAGKAALTPPSGWHVRRRTKRSGFGWGPLRPTGCGAWPRR